MKEKGRLLSQGHLPLGERAGGLIMQITSPWLTGKFQSDLFKISLLGEAETAIRLCTKSW